MTALIEGGITGDQVWLDQPYIRTAEASARAAEAWASLTPRQREVAMLISMGVGRIELEAMFGCTVRTIDSHRTKLMSKLGVSNAVRLARWALRHGYVTLEDVT